MKLLLPLRRAKQFLIKKRNERIYQASGFDYDAKKYWEDRHIQYNYDSLQGVGRSDLTQQENEAWYRSAELIFKGMLNELSLDKENSKVLEFGYGTGFYTKILSQLGYKNYLGVDIVDKHIPFLEKEIVNFQGKLVQADVGVRPIDFKSCSLVVSIDMTQHIVNDDKMRFFLRENVYENLVNDGVFIVTDSLQNAKFSFYETSRNIQFYEKSLNMKLFQPPALFRDKYIFSFKKV